MKLTRHDHACVTIEHDATTIVIDPGTLTPDAADVLRHADAALITHSHFDHFDADAIRAALESQPELRVYGPQSVVDALAGTAAFAEGRVISIDHDTHFAIGALDIDAFAGEHGVIHSEIPVPANVAYLVGGSVLHPGDAYLAPGVPVDTLLLPVSGPWTVMAEAIDYVRAVAPRQTVPIHDVLLSEVGRRGTDRMLGQSSLTGTPMLPVAPGETVEL
jgi:L-ascorbate metabolism protein UlaG (beta-lactamase superfamily)